MFITLEIALELTVFSTFYVTSRSTTKFRDVGCIQYKADNNSKRSKAIILRKEGKCTPYWNTHKKGRSSL